MGDFYEDYCVTLPRQQEVAKRTVPVVEKWSTLLQGTNTLHFSLASLSPMHLWKDLFSLMTAAWTDLIKSEIQVKNNFAYSCTEFYSYDVKEKVLLEAVRSNKKYTFKKKN